MSVYSGAQRSPVVRPQKVQVFSIGKSKPSVDRERRRHLVKWRVDGRDRTRSFKTRTEAERFRSSLQGAARDGETFDEATGLPVRWVDTRTGPTWWTWSRDWLLVKWPQWSGHSRRSAIEAASVVTPLLVVKGAPAAPAELAAWLRNDGYLPDTEPKGEMAEWLERWSIPLADIDPQLLERVLHAVSRRADGRPLVASVVRRRRNQLATMLRSAVRRGLIGTNPMDRVEWRNPVHSMVVDVSTVPSPDDVAAAIAHVQGMRQDARRYAAMFGLVGIAGMRPPEAVAVRIEDLQLPETGWGLVKARGAITAPGRLYTTEGTAVEAKGLKHRPVGTVREVPLSPRLVPLLREHLAMFEPVNGRIFSNAAGRPVTAANYYPVWTRTRAALWPAGHPLAGTTVYDLRHAAATMMLRAGVPPAEVALRLGHSVDVLMRVYAGVFDDERDRSNQLIDEALGEIA